MAVVREPDIKFVTVVGRVYIDDEGYQRLLYVAWKYRYSLLKAVQMLYKGLSEEYVEKVITQDMNQGYAKAVIDQAKLVIKDAEYHGTNPLKSKIKKFFIASKGRANIVKGNQNIRLISTDKLIVNYNFGGKGGKHGKWIECDIGFGGEYIPLIKYIVNKSLEKELPYSARILIRGRKDIKIHLSIPTWTYIEYF